jgi:hypothetical protein
VKVNGFEEIVGKFGKYEARASRKVGNPKSDLRFQN